MFARERDYSAFLQTVRIDVGTLVGLEKDEDAYIVLKELPTLEMLRLKEASDKGERATLEVIRELLPSMITDHSFFEDTKGQKKMKAEDIAEPGKGRCRQSPVSLSTIGRKMSVIYSSHLPHSFKITLLRCPRKIEPERLAISRLSSSGGNEKPLSCTHRQPSP